MKTNTVNSQFDSKIKRFEDLDAWKKARELTNLLYGISARSRLAKEFDLSRQMKRSGVSITSNIAEGFERAGDRELHRFLSIAKGSCGELRSQVIVSFDQGLITSSQSAVLHRKTEDLSKILAGLMRSINRKVKKSS